MSARPGFESNYQWPPLDLARLPIRLERSESRGRREHNRAWRIAQIGERLLALILLALVLPLLCFTAVVVCLLSRRSPLVAHGRVGRHGQRLWVLKIRTMWDGTVARGGGGFLIERLRGETVPIVKSISDPRVTNRFAATCRKYSIDELPQLWHVLKGEMALVGPRPLTAAELLEYYREDAPEILSVKPGLTGLWQIGGRSRLNYQERRRLDLRLVRNWSFRLYLRVLIGTVPKVLMGKDAW